MCVTVRSWLAIVLVLVSGSLASAASPSDRFGPVDGLRQLPSALSVEAVLARVAPAHGELLILYGGFTVHGNRVTDGVVVRPNDAVEDVTHAWASYRDTFAAAQAASATEPLVVGYEVVGARQDSPPIVPDDDYQTPPVPYPRPVPDTPDPVAWLPSGGSVETGQLSNTERFVRQELSWINTSGFSEDSTFEPDFALNASDGSREGPETYLSNGEQFGTRLPEVHYFQSNLPDPYLDVRFQDDGYLYYYTVGSGRAADIQPNTDYYTLIVTDHGEADRDQGALSMQLGHRSEALCGAGVTWCSFSNEIFAIVPMGNDGWTIEVPGTFRWTYPNTVQLPPVPPPTQPSISSEIEAEVVEPEEPSQPTPTPTPIPPAPTPTPIPQPESVYYGPFDLNAGCQWYHNDSNAYATQLDGANPYSWRCVSEGAEFHIDLDAIAKYHYGPNACAYLGDDGYWYAASC